jgi:hypothetical protein
VESGRLRGRLARRLARTRSRSNLPLESPLCCFRRGCGREALSAAAVAVRLGDDRRSRTAAWRHKERRRPAAAARLLPGECASGARDRDRDAARSERPRCAYARRRDSTGRRRGCSSSVAATRSATTTASARAGEAGAASCYWRKAGTPAVGSLIPALAATRACSRRATTPPSSFVMVTM